MMRSTRIVAVLTLTAAALIHSSVTATARQETLSVDKGVFLMRVILGYENPTSDRKGYVNLADLLRTPEWPPDSRRQEEGLPEIHVIDSTSGTTLNYVVQVTTSDDKRHFQASLEPTDPKTCLGALFTDDRGIIYVGKGLGCPADRR